MSLKCPTAKSRKSIIVYFVHAPVPPNTGYTFAIRKHQRKEIRKTRKIVDTGNNVNVLDQVTETPSFPSDLFQRPLKTDFANLRVGVRLVLRVVTAIYADTYSRYFVFQPNAPRY